MRLNNYQANGSAELYSKYNMRVLPVEMAKKSTFANYQDIPFNSVVGNMVFCLLWPEVLKSAIKYNEVIPGPR